MEQLLTAPGGALMVPRHPIIDRADGGNLWVMPPRPVWDRSELKPEELTQWSFLIAAAGRAMLDVLPQLDGGVVNYWEAGNWALNAAAEPEGPKVGRRHKHVHMHLIGRSPASTDPDWAWGEAPVYPRYPDVESWWSSKANLDAEERRRVAEATADRLVSVYGVSRGDIVVATP